MNKQTTSYDDLIKTRLSEQEIAHNRAEAKRHAKRIFLSDLRKLAGKTQGIVADTMGISPSNLSRLESQDSMQWASLMRLADALGIRLDLIATFPDGKQFPVTLGTNAPRKRGRPKKIKTSATTATAIASKVHKKKSA